ncbi:MAG: DNA polymerase III subunit beta [Bacillota bacterium]|nr:DNA polymerase III subunit beta [Bacillota bacterium]
MKINIQKEDLLYAVQAVERAVSNKNTLPVLGGIMMQAVSGRLYFRATDLELAMECVINADIEEEGEVVVPGRKFSGMVRTLPGGNVHLESLGREQLLVKYENEQSEFTVPCFAVEEFPILPQPEGDIQGYVPVRVFRRLVKQVSIAAAADEARPVFTGVLMELSDDKLVMVATDTHRLAMGSGVWQGKGQLSLIMPARTLQEIGRLAVNDEENITIIAGKSQAHFTLGNISFTSRVIVGQFPEYKQVLPAESLFCTHIELNNARLSGALERASMLSRESMRGKGNIVRLACGEGKLVMTAEVPDEGMIREDIPAGVAGEPLTVNYNARYMLDVLKVLEEESLIFHLTGATTPGVIKPAGENADEYLYLILPVRVSK